MEYRELADRILGAQTLDEKLQRFPDELTDHVPGDAVRWERPARPENLEFAPRRTAPLMPHPHAFAEAEKRGLAHHILANHELQALEVMAWVLLAFPRAPSDFRAGLVQIMDDERRHTLLHSARAEQLRVPFGSRPVNSYIWSKSMAFESELEYVAGLPLVFEGANLDHTLDLEAAFLAGGDEKGAAICRRIHRDEIEHVRFGIDWLRRLKPAGVTDYEAWESALHWPLRPHKAIGDTFHEAPRLAAGLDSEFIARLAATEGEKTDQSH